VIAYKIALVSFKMRFLCFCVRFNRSEIRVNILFPELIKGDGQQNHCIRFPVYNNTWRDEKQQANFDEHDFYL